jgi:hypothetical protein
MKFSHSENKEAQRLLLDRVPFSSPGASFIVDERSYFVRYEGLGIKLAFASPKGLNLEITLECGLERQNWAGNTNRDGTQMLVWSREAEPYGQLFLGEDTRHIKLPELRQIVEQALNDLKTEMTTRGVQRRDEDRAAEQQRDEELRQRL